MGTSSSYGGPSGASPLVPSWLGTGGGELAPIPQDIEPAEQEQIHTPNEVGNPDRFQAARANFTRFAGSGGRDKAALSRAIRSYVSTSMGGSRTATRRMGASLPVGMRLLSVLANTVDRGAATALREFQLQRMVGSPVTDVLVELMDRLCPSDGSIDSSIAREAFAETIAELSEAEELSFESVSLEELRVIFGLYVAHSIELRLFNDIGSKGINVPSDHDAALAMQRELHDFISGAVHEAVERQLSAGAQLSENWTRRTVERVYRDAFDILTALSDGGTTEP